MRKRKVTMDAPDDGSDPAVMAEVLAGWWVLLANVRVCVGLCAGLMV